MSKLYIVATPIGNLEDMTFRAIRILKEVDTILCEDTRVTRKLLSHYEIDRPAISYNDHSGLSKVDKIATMLEAGKDLALVSDAGTPGISDPGAQLVSYVREALPEVEIIPIPGASAITTLLSASGITNKEFIFLGFLPHKKGRETMFKEISEAVYPVVVYESPHRVLKTLTSLKKYVGDKNIIIGRELTKKFEQIISGKPDELLEYFEKNEGKRKGEFVIIIS